MYLFTNYKIEGFFLKKKKLKNTYILFDSSINKCNMAKSYEFLPLCLELHISYS